MSEFLISAAHKSSGKTTISLGLAAAFRARGLTVAPFKKGPDYIDPIWLSRAAGRDCHNLDFHTMTAVEIHATFVTHGAGADVVLVEGNKGLFDGVDLHGGNSNAALCSALNLPVVLVIDTRGMTRGIAPLLFGYTGFEPGIRFAGVILNQVGGPRHEAKLRAAVAEYTDLEVLGAVARNPVIEIGERHLGLIPGNEHRHCAELIDDLAGVMEEQIDLDRILALTVSGGPRETAETPALPAPDVTIAVARDAAFGFYYPGDMHALRAAGASLIGFDTLRDPGLPPADALFIGGGFPESHMRELAKNRSMREDIRRAIENGLPAYAECGGLMYLARRIVWDGADAPMCGVLPIDIEMSGRPQGRGYVELRETECFPWPGGDHRRGLSVHEFHYSKIVNQDRTLPFAFRVERGFGIDGCHDGFVYKNLLAGFSHMRDVAANPWAGRFVAFVRQTLAGAGRGAVNAASARPE